MSYYMDYSKDGLNKEYAWNFLASPYQIECVFNKLDQYVAYWFPVEGL